MKVSRLRLRLLETGQPMYVIAARIGVAPTRLSEYCTGKRDIPQRHIITLCQVLRCDPQDITGFMEQEMQYRGRASVHGR